MKFTNSERKIHSIARNYQPRELSPQENAAYLLVQRHPVVLEPYIDPATVPFGVAQSDEELVSIINKQWMVGTPIHGLAMAAMDRSNTEAAQELFDKHPVVARNLLRKLSYTKDGLKALLAYGYSDMSESFLTACQEVYSNLIKIVNSVPESEIAYFVNSDANINYKDWATWAKENKQPEYFGMAVNDKLFRNIVVYQYGHTSVFIKTIVDYKLNKDARFLDGLEPGLELEPREIPTKLQPWRSSASALHIKLGKRQLQVIV